MSLSSEETEQLTLVSRQENVVQVTSEQRLGQIAEELLEQRGGVVRVATVVEHNVLSGVVLVLELHTRKFTSFVRTFPRNINFQKKMDLPPSNVF